MFPVFIWMNKVKIIDGVESEMVENHCEKDKWDDDMLPEEEDLIRRLHRLLGDR